MEFSLGQLFTTIGIKNLIGEVISNDDILSALTRHASCDWSEMSEHDQELNRMAVINGDDRVFSSYTLKQTKVWVITEGDRSYTTVLLPSEY